MKVIADCRLRMENPPRRSGTPPVEGRKKKQSPPLEGWPKAGVGHSAISNPKSPMMKRGSALVVVLWILMIIALIVSTFAFEMQLESRIITLQRKRFKADQLALAGVELAKMLILFEEKDVTKSSTGERLPYGDWRDEAVKIPEGVPVMGFSETFGDGTVTIDVDYEKGRLNINTIQPEIWKEIFKQAGVPNIEWDKLIACLDDWKDENDEHHANGAESDDSFYRKRDYECKNAPVDTVDELLLIKGWTPEILYGTPPDLETEEPISGVANQLTTWGDGKVNVNNASREVLRSMGLTDDVIDAIFEARAGPDGKWGTQDDGLIEADLASLGLEPSLFTTKDQESILITSVGEVSGVKSRVSCIFKLAGKELKPLFWAEGKQELRRPMASDNEPSK